MKFSPLNILSFIATLASVNFTTDALSQQSTTSRFWIGVTEAADPLNYKMVFGNDVRATYGIDCGVDGTYDLGETEPGPSPPSGLLLRWMSIPGRELATLVNENRQPGTHVVSWDATNVSSGIYFYKFSAMPINRSARLFIDVKKMVVSK